MAFPHHIMPPAAAPAFRQIHGLGMSTGFYGMGNEGMHGGPVVAVPPHAELGQPFHPPRSQFLIQHEIHGSKEVKAAKMAHAKAVAKASRPNSVGVSGAKAIVDRQTLPRDAAASAPRMSAPGQRVVPPYALPGATPFGEHYAEPNAKNYTRYPIAFPENGKSAILEYKPTSKHASPFASRVAYPGHKYVTLPH